MQNSKDDRLRELIKNELAVQGVTNPTEEFLEHLVRTHRRSIITRIVIIAALTVIGATFIYWVRHL